MNSELKLDFTRRITQSNSSEIIAILYEIFFVYLEDGREAIENGDFEAAREELRHASTVVQHLKDALNRKYELSAQLYPLYDFCQRAIEKSNYRRNVVGIDEARKVMEPLQEAFRQIANLDQSESVMKNTQTVMAGMTYGRGILNETTVYENNRGFLA
ncbi:MAG: flagellar protein FliS [Lachnospiraceae bacterium]|nr:flagellar protein FliS [Lachnospiraceae bacterium]